MAKATTGRVSIPAPKFETAIFEIEGTAPYVQNKFSAKAQEIMRATQEAGSTAKKGKKKEPKDFEALCAAATYRSKEGWCGIPACTFRNAIISVCRVVGFTMTLAKLSVFVEDDGFDADSGDPLVRITQGEPHMDVRPARNASGVCDLRPRPMFDCGWKATVRIRYDADQFTREDVANLMFRVGLQNGIGEGRPFSKDSNGCGWGLFQIV